MLCRDDREEKKLKLFEEATCALKEAVKVTVKTKDEKDSEYKQSLKDLDEDYNDESSTMTAQEYKFLRKQIMSKRYL